MDISTVRLLTIHLPSLLPPSTTQLDVTHSTKIAALIGLGLLYHGSTHRCGSLSDFFTLRRNYFRPPSYLI